MRGARRKHKTEAGQRAASPDGRDQTAVQSGLPKTLRFQETAGKEDPRGAGQGGPPNRPGMTLDEERCFLDAVSDVRPLGGTTRKVFSMPDPNLRPAHTAPDEELEAMARLSDLVSGVAGDGHHVHGRISGGLCPWIQPEIDAEIETRVIFRSRTSWTFMV